MKISNKIKIGLILMLSSLIATGCWDQKIYERIGFVLQIGIEPSEDGRLLVSYTDPVTDPKRPEQVEIIKGSSNLLREFKKYASGISAKAPEAGKVQQIVISKSLAEKGINNLLEVFERDPANPAIAYLVISETSPKDLINFAQRLEDKPRPALYLNQLLQNNIDSSECPKTTIFDFTTTSLAEGIDAIVPLIREETEENKGIRVIGSALFSHDKYVGKLNVPKTSLLIAMKGKMKPTEYIFKSIGPPPNDSSGKSGAVVLLLKCKKKLDVKIVDNIPVVNIYLTFKGNFIEQSWDSIAKSESQLKTENIMAEELKSECMDILKYTQAINSDPIGVGDIVRAKYNSFWKANNWDETYKKVIFNVNVKMDIVRFGVLK